MMNYHKKRFKPVQTSENGETNQETIFEYHQTANCLKAEYKGGQIVFGQLIGIVAKDGSIDMRYQQINKMGVLMTGMCKSIPQIMDNGKIRLHESWQWTSGDGSKGMSILEEI